MKIDVEALNNLAVANRVNILVQILANAKIEFNEEIPFHLAKYILNE